MRWVWIVPLACAAVLAQMHSTITREHDGFVQTTTGSIAVPPAARFRVTTAGTVVVRGGAEQEIAYTVVQKVRAASDAEARRQLPNVIVRNSTRAGWNHLTVVTGDPALVGSELYLTVPKELRQVVVVSMGGNVEAYDLDGSVDAETVGGRVQMDRIGSNATARTGGSDIRIGRVDGILRCFSGGGSIQVDSAGGETWCETAGGEIAVGRVTGVLHATTAGGNIRVRQAGAAVIARSDGGLIEVGRAGGVVTAQTRGGAIEIGSSPGAQCESAAGAIRIRGAGGPLRAQTAMGSILAELTPGIHLQESSLNSGLGDITVFIPSNLAVSVQALSDIKSRHPRIISDFPEIRVKRPDGAWSVGPVTAEGSLNGGGPVLRITASSGTIYLRRQK
jgi:DUF4097 and DUF4098 domain-containing protein YvlB